MIDKFLVLLSLLLLSSHAQAVPVCSTGANGIATVSAAETRVNVYYAAPDPSVPTALIAGSASIPIDAVLGPQASNLHAAVNSAIAAGDVLLVLQMMGIEIDSSDNHLTAGDYGDGPAGLNQAGSLNNSNFTVGQYEFVVATGPVASGAIPIEGAGVANGLINSYINSNATTAALGYRRYQVVKVPQFSRLAITSTGSVVSDRWNGRWGGISAINVRDNLLLDGGSFNADGRGYRGGQFFPLRSDDPSGNFGFKGEGTAGMPQRLFSRVLLAEQPGSEGEETGPIGYAGTDGGGPGGTAWTRDTGQGAPGTAGSGGGGGEDAGGGGGGNFGRGGAGGWGVDGANTEGMGGASFPEHFASTPARFVMGGGGGSSNGDDTAALDLTVSSGQAGGGMVFVRSLNIDATAGGIISANGDSGASAASEGGGGGGAGGTALIHTDNSTVDGVAFAAVGGMGGSSENNLDGGGGGGSGGVIWLSDTSVGSATFNLAGGAGGIGNSGGSYNGMAGDAGLAISIAPIAQFDCNFVTLGLSREVANMTRIGTTGAVFDITFSMVVENFSASTDAINVQITDELDTAFPGVNSIVIQGTPSIGGFSAPSTAFNGESQPNLLAGTDSLTAGAQRTMTYTVRVDFGAATGPFNSQAMVTSSQIAGGFAQVMDLSDTGSDPDPDGDNDPSETLAGGGDSEENDATPIVLDLTPPAVPTVNSLTTENTTPTLIGTFNSSDAAGGFTVTVNGVTYTLGDGNLSNTGDNWSLTIPVVNALPLGTYPVTATATDGVGNSASDATTNELVVQDITPPTAPTVLSQTTEDTTPILTGTYDSADTAGGLTVALNGVTYTLGDGNLSNTGDNWSLAIPAGDVLPLATYDVVATATDGTGNSTSDATTNELVVQDVTAPTAPTVLSQTTEDTTPILTGTFDSADAAGGFTVSVNGVTYTLGDGNLSNTGDTWSLAIPVGNALPLGTYPVTATATDSVGNSASDATTNELVVQDVTPPTAPTVLSQTTEDTTPILVGTYDSADAAGGFTVVLNGVTYTLGDGNLSNISDNWSLAIPAGDVLPLASYDVVATATDGAGNSASDATTNELIITVSNDPDGDGVTNPIDLDDDNDGIPDSLEGDGAVDTDGDTVVDSLDLDSDNDGLFDLHESGADASTLDTDDDGRIDAVNGVGSNGLADVVETSTDSGSINYSGGTLLDTDGDSVADFRDLDSDNDGIPDVIEAGGSDPDGDGILGIGTPTVDADGLVTGAGLLPVDTDGDGQPDTMDLDSDNDGLTDLLEAGGVDADSDGLVDGFTDADSDGFDDLVEATPLPLPDSDGDGIPDYRDNDDSDNDGIGDTLDLDDDNDGIPDVLEDDGGVDTDGDGVADSLDLDSDNDGLYDLHESGADASALDTDDDGRIDAANDVGSNGLADALETTADSGSINYTLRDTDSDTVHDFRDLDSDNDGIPDVIEAGGSDDDGDGEIGSGSPTVDADGVPAAGGLTPPDTDGDGATDQLDLDADDDGINDLLEAGGDDTDDDGMVDGFTDTDSNGLDDGLDASVGGTPLTSTDSNGDGIPDYLDNTDSDTDGIVDSVDLDDDNDGITDLDEGSGTVDTDGDAVVDSLDLDADNDGLFDLIESGAEYASDPDANDDGRIDDVGAGDTNGLADVLETVANNGTINYTLRDTDSDTVHDFRDLDSDNDGIPDVIEAGGSDADGDGVIGTDTPTVDADGVPAAGGLTPPDTDGDGATDQLDLDTDGDGLADLVEAGGDDADNDGRIDSFTDLNSDGLHDDLLINPLPISDSDTDRVADFRDLDSDNDGIYDVIEAQGDDADGDGRQGGAPQSVDENGVTDGGLLAPLDTDGDGVQDQQDLDSDNDGIPDVIEAGGNDPEGDGILGIGTPIVDVDGLVTGAGLLPVDTDGEGQPDTLDLDSDNDGFSDLLEAGGVDADSDGLVDGFTDADGDGYDDLLELTPLLPLPDSDGDGIPDYRDNDDSDNDGIGDGLDLDDDNDGIPDSDEGPAGTDTDGDGVADSLDLDSDNDGLFDLAESGADSLSNSLDADNDGRIDASNGVGSNGLADLVETSPDSDVIAYTLRDTDSDSVYDFRDLDSDNDGLYDITEAGGSDPDKDGIIGTGTPVVNQEGVAAGSGLIAGDFDSDGVTDQLDLDSDNDGIPDVTEAGGSDPDGDGIPGTGVPIVDGAGVPVTGAGLIPPDTDGDGQVDTKDLDADGDNIFDLVEAGGTDSDGDGQVDGFTDADGNGLDDGLQVNPLPLLDSDGNGVPDYLDMEPLLTGLNGVGGCTIGRSTGIDPLLPVLLLFSLLYLGYARRCKTISSEK